MLRFHSSELAVFSHSRGSQAARRDLYERDCTYESTHRCMRSYTTACLGVVCKASIFPRRNSIRASSIISGQDASLSSEHGHQFPLECEPDCINSNASHATLCLLFLLGYRFHWSKECSRLQLELFEWSHFLMTSFGTCS